MPISLQNCICCWKLSTSLQSSNFVVGKCRLHSQIEVGVGNSYFTFKLIVIGNCIHHFQHVNVVGNCILHSKTVDVVGNCLLHNYETCPPYYCVCSGLIQCFLSFDTVLPQPIYMFTHFLILSSFSFVTVFT